MKCAQTPVNVLFASLCLMGTAVIVAYEIPVKRTVTVESDGSRLVQQFDMFGKEHGMEVEYYSDGSRLVTHYSHGVATESIEYRSDGQVEFHVWEDWRSGLQLKFSE